MNGLRVPAPFPSVNLGGVDEDLGWTAEQKVEMIAQAAVRTLADYAEYADKLGFSRFTVVCLPTFPNADTPEQERWLNYAIADRIKQIVEDVDMPIGGLRKFELLPFDQEVPMRRWAAEVSLWGWRVPYAVTEPFANRMLRSAFTWLKDRAEDELERTFPFVLPSVQPGDMHGDSPLLYEVYNYMLERDPSPVQPYYTIVPQEVDYRKSLLEHLHKLAQEQFYYRRGVLWKISDRGLTVKRTLRPYTRKERQALARAGWKGTNRLSKCLCSCFG